MDIAEGDTTDNGAANAADLLPAIVGHSEAADYQGQDDATENQGPSYRIINLHCASDKIMDKRF
ncbi:hypothetical protein ASD07_04515 [Duganella sp. Root336D2]|nr:hypothetical protein ASD07_04515 [Duganella sp. Root336D2]